MAIFVFKKTCKVEADNLEEAIKKAKGKKFSKEIEIDTVIH